MIRHVAYLYAGVVLVVVASFVGLAWIPDRQLGALDPVEDSEGIRRPAPAGGIVGIGRRVYVDLGCIYCHSQQVRPEGFGADLERGWGTRRSVARDHLYDRPPLLGTMRTGPDLLNIGARQPSAAWHSLHLYNPRITSEGSIMPAFPFLFERRERGPNLPARAIELPPAWRSEGYTHIVPKDRARALVAYLQSLDHGYFVPEAGGG